MAIYMQVEGASGDLTAKGYNRGDRKWFELESISFDLSRTVADGSSQGQDDSPKMSAIEFTKKIDSSSIELWNLVNQPPEDGVTVKCNFVKTGQKMFEAYVMYVFEKCDFRKYAPGAESESCNFECKKVTFSYRAADVKGRLQPPQHTYWEDSSGDEE